jgi:hypothetical protein
MVVLWMAGNRPLPRFFWLLELVQQPAYSERN